ncbi:MAG TPA: phospholipase D-like domain-containing protein [Chthoniobacterales bacterium]|jgi:cardiolipin synthase|nr:phospholipase D-like domain-containing protein [Chthoniobacterales bacterium]
MAKKRSSSAHWLNQKWWRLELAEWIGVTLCFLGVILVFCLFFIRRNALEYHLEHQFAVSDPEFFGSALALSNPLPIPGNKIDLLQNGDEFFPAMLDAIRSAKKTVNFAAYIVKSDATGHQFRDALCERARAGVEVRVLLDGIGSGLGLDNSDVRRMTDAGCKFAYYHPVQSWRLDRTNRRSHRRMLIVDGKVGFTGGAAFSDKWSGHAQDKDHWRDIHARLEGPVVAQLQAAFQSHWVKTFGESLTGAGQFPALPTVGDQKAQIVESFSFSSAAPVPMVQAVAFASAEKRIWITNPYCTPSEDQVELLVKAVQRKVDVRFLLPGPYNDQPMTQSAGRTAYGRLLEGGVKIFEYQPTMIHAKTMVVDGLFSMLGSSNIDPRSSEINEEIDVVVYDQAFGRQMEEVFEKDLAQSREYTLEEFKKRPVWERVSEWLMVPFRSQL